jgi:16S rRNA (guanine527-N7)-methyltransferase
MPDITDLTIQNELLPYGVDATQEQCEAIRSYIRLLRRWNQRISLTRVTRTADILQFHFGESVFAASTIQIRDGRLADVGSGAGFPGLALRIFISSLNVTLIEANAKKAAFLKEASRELALDGVEVFHGRANELIQENKNFDYITVRAVGQHDKLLKWSRELIKSHGKLILWLGEPDIKEISRCEGWDWGQPHHIPGSKRRFILSGSPTT